VKDFTVELTTHKKIHEVNNDKCHNYYYVQYGRIYNAERKRYRKFKFVFWFDIFDVMEYFDKDIVSQKEIVEFANELAWNICETYEGGIKSYNDCEAFYDWCNETIDEYNK
jgi:hypothetical protein